MLTCTFSGWIILWTKGRIPSKRPPPTFLRNLCLRGGGRLQGTLQYFLTYAHHSRWSIGHLQPLSIALCSGLLWPCRLFLAQRNVLICCRRCFCKLSFLQVGSLALRKPLYPPGEVVLRLSPLTTCVAGQWVCSVPNPQGRCLDITLENLCI